MKANGIGMVIVDHINWNEYASCLECMEPGIHTHLTSFIDPRLKQHLKRSKTYRQWEKER